MDKVVHFKHTLSACRVSTCFTSRTFKSRRESDFCAVTSVSTKEISIPLRKFHASIAFSFFPTLRRVHRAARLSEMKEIISLILKSHAVSFFSPRRLPYEIVAARAEKWRRKRSALSRARLSDPRGCTRSCRRSQDAEDAEERSEADGRRDNEIEMAKADHRIGWLNRGWRSRSRRTRTRGLIRPATALSARVSCSTKLILNRNISVE